jgi:hypothetical protein
MLRSLSSFTWHAALMLLALLTSSCGTSDSTASDPNATPNDTIGTLVPLGQGLLYAPESNSIRVADLDAAIENPYFLSLSRNREALIYSAPMEHSDTEVYVQFRDGLRQRLTANEFTEGYPVINDDGTYAYVLYDHLSNSSSIVVNGVPVTKTDATTEVRHLAMSPPYLAYSQENRTTDEYHLVLHDLLSGAKRFIPITGIIQNVVTYGPSFLLLHVFEPTGLRLTVQVYDTSSDTLRLLRESPAPQFPILDDDGQLHILEPGAADDALALFHALYTWRTNHLTNALAFSNNFLGDLTWHSAYVIEGLVRLHELTGREVFRIQVAKAVTAIMEARNEFLIPAATNVPGFLWATRKYSLDQATPTDLLIADARILYALLLSANSGLLDPSLESAVYALAERSYDYFESQFSIPDGLYRIRYGVSFWADGVWAPFNWQNAFGLMLIELFKATGEAAFHNRVRELAQRFRSEWVITSDARALWHYWPAEFYRGWTPGDAVSVNTPSWPATTDTLFEDVSHAGINVKFILEYQKAFGTAIFDEDDLQAISRTVSDFTSAGEFSRFLSGDTSYTAASYRYLPLYGWSQLQHPVLKLHHTALIPNAGAVDLIAYLDAISPQAAPTLSLDTFEFNHQLELVSTEQKIFAFRDIPDLFGL